MVIRAFLFFSILACFSCTKEKPDNTWFEAEWIYVTDTTNLFDPTYVGLKFKNDSLISNSNIWSLNEGRYSIHNDTIYVNELSDSSKIVRITSDSLILLFNNEILRYYNRKLEYNDNLKYQNIILKTGKCFGECPEFVLILNQDGRVELKGIKNTNKPRLTNYLLGSKDKQKIDSLFKWTNINKTDTSTFYGTVDDWTISITFELEGGGQRKINGTLSSMPYRLKGIIWILLHDLKKRALIY